MREDDQVNDSFFGEPVSVKIEDISLLNTIVVSWEKDGCRFTI